MLNKENKHVNKCTICGEIFSQNELLMQHTSDLHNFECKFCKKHAATNVELERHIEEEHIQITNIETVDDRDINVEDEEMDITEKYRQLKNHFERLNTLFQQSQERLSKVKEEYSHKLDEAIDKYATLIQENEELKTKVTILFKLSESYIEKHNLREINNEVQTSPTIAPNKEIVSTAVHEGQNQSLASVAQSGTEGQNQPPTSDAGTANDCGGTGSSVEVVHQVRFEDHPNNVDTAKTQESASNNTINERLQAIANQNSSEINEQHKSTRYCHYYTNYDRRCYYEERSGRQCRYVHKMAPLCQNGRSCTKEKCMYSHPKAVGLTSNQNNNFLPTTVHPNHQLWGYQTSAIPMVYPWMNSFNPYQHQQQQQIHPVYQQWHQDSRNQSR